MSEVILYTTEDGLTRIAQATVNPQLTVQNRLWWASPVEIDGFKIAEAACLIEASGIRKFRTTAFEEGGASA
jgi:hypothetical protein